MNGFITVDPEDHTKHESRICVASETDLTM